MAAAAAVIGLVATAMAAVPGDLVTGELATLRWANDLPSWLGTPLRLVMNIGTSIGALLVVVAAAVGRKRRVAVAGFVAWLAARLLSTVVKVVVDRGRPPALVTDVVLRQHLPADPGYPSSHAAVAAALAVVAGWGWRPLRVPLAVLAALIGLARLYVGVHLPLDVLGGWALGALCGLGAIAIVHPRVPPHPEPAPWSRRRPTVGRSQPPAP